MLAWLLSSSLCLTIEGDGLSEGQYSNVAAVIVNAIDHKGQVVAVVNDSFHFRHVGIGWFVVDGAHQHTPVTNKAITASKNKETKKKKKKTHAHEYNSIQKTFLVFNSTLRQSLGSNIYCNCCRMLPP